MAEFPALISVKSIKRQIIQTHQSYHNDYDILAEIVQNSVDAILERQHIDESFDKGKINIYVNSTNNSIKVEDNGVGMSKKQLDKAVQLNHSDKDSENKKYTVGEKGIGLSFSIFESNDALITTSDGENTSEAHALNAQKWVIDPNQDNKFTITVSNSNQHREQGTTVSLSNIANSNSFFGLNIDQLIFTLRTRTAIGNTQRLWGEKVLSIQTSVTLEKENSKIDKKKINENKYLLLDDLRPNIIESIEDFNTRYGSSSSTDAQKRNFLQGKFLCKSGCENVSGRDIKYYAYFAPNGDGWKKRSLDYNLLPNGFDSDVPDYTQFTSGIYLSVKGMPTGISLNTNFLKGAIGYVNRMYMIIEDPALTFDIGRKSIASRTKGKYKNIAQNVYKDYLEIARKWLQRDSSPRTDSESTSSKFHTIEDNSTNLNMDKITHFNYVPNQEGTVSGMFFELLGKEAFPNLRILQHGYSNIYDLYAQIKTTKKTDDIILEFKLHVKDFIQDIVKGIKKWSDVNYLVVFDFTTTDEQYVMEQGFSVAKEENLLDDHLFACASIDSQANEPIYIISIKDILNRNTAKLRK